MRLATVEDMDEVLRMAEAFVGALKIEVGFDELSCAKTALNLMNDVNSVVLLDDGAMIGGIVYPHFFNHNVLMAQELLWWCDPAKRGSGSARRLWDAFESWAVSRGAKHVSMISLADMKSVAKLYERRGYKPLETTWVKAWQ